MKGCIFGYNTPTVQHLNYLYLQDTKNKLINSSIVIVICMKSSVQHIQHCQLCIFSVQHLKNSVQHTPTNKINIQHLTILYYFLFNSIYIR